MDTRYRLFMVRWENGTYSIYFGTGKYPMHDILDEIGDPGAAEARAIPRRFAGFFCINQMTAEGRLELEACEYFVTLDELWAQCKPRLWPESSYPPKLQVVQDSDDRDANA
jgi:hypothetical protein